MAFDSLDQMQFRLTVADLRKKSDQELNQIKVLCQTNLRFLVNCVLRPPNLKKFPPMSEKVQGRIIDALLKPSPDMESEDWDTHDEFVALASRGMLKSTIGAALLTQIILCAPDIRILIISGSINKSRSILAMARNPFASNEVLRYLFPEWALVEIEGTEEFTTPRRNPELELRDPTISISSFDAIKAGGHFEIILFDDATNEINSNTMENCEKTHGTYDDCDPLLEPGGYRIFLGTKWHTEDLPEYIRKNGESDREKTGESTVKYFVLPAWTLRTDGSQKEIDARKIREKNGVLLETDVDLTWSEKLTARYLFKRYRKNRADFYKQYLLDATVTEQFSFTDEILNKQIVARCDLNQIPFHDRAVVCHWDFASVYSGRRKMSENDYSCGITAVFQRSTNKMYIADARLEHFVNGDDMAAGIITMLRTAHMLGPVVALSMEDAVGIRNIESNTIRFAKEMSVTLPGINYILPDKAYKAKNSNIAILASVMKNGQAFILSDIPFFDEIKVQFEKFTLDAKRRKDDGPDCIAQIWKYYGGQVFPLVIPGMEPEGPILTWTPDAPPTPEDPHMEERADADIDWLASFTAPHAGN